MESWRGYLYFRMEYSDNRKGMVKDGAADEYRKCRANQAVFSDNIACTS